MTLRAFVVALAIFFTTNAVAFLGTGMYALNGFGKPVSWWFILKLPAHIHRSENASSERTPCKCSSPICGSTIDSVQDRSHGLCYLYADSENPSLEYFETLGYDCLGQGGNDPLSHTLRQMNTSLSFRDRFWAYFSDQYDRLSTVFPGAACEQSSRFSAHAKGAVAFDAKSGGFYLQTSTPNYPDPSDLHSFTPLGCQKDNNVLYSQHLMAVSLDQDGIDSLGKALQAARLCSANYYDTRNEDLKERIVSSSFRQAYQDPTNEFYENARMMGGALLDPALESISQSREAVLKLKQPEAYKSTQDLDGSAVYQYLPGGEILVLPDFAKGAFPGGNWSVQLIVKSPKAEIPPWAIVAQVLEEDLSVATWWDESVGIPTICASDQYSMTPFEFCLNDRVHGVFLNANGTAAHNIENLVEAKWTTDSTKNDTVHWHLVGGRQEDGNHAKWGVTTSRFGVVAPDSKVIFADLNMEGYPCSTTCHGSQAGRGGSFFILSQPVLHQSLVNLVSKACQCSAVAESYSENATAVFEEARMCHRGCVKKITQRLTSTSLPKLSSEARSFWNERHQ
uniref:Uncharacterized protein AlNc14C74G5019 n=1 Tax=Albugo laibachii Nc14 TaxID=890382 RepID=F0WEG5_9STRA|nr:conserved hypothetical protein [Albugo laibachii Nc14]|eukprot:CCA19597.1 conserved hypothetical protein [Albugo laibachii Nc14]